MDPVLESKRLCKDSLFFLCTKMLGYKDWDLCHTDMERFLLGTSAKKMFLIPRNHLKTSLGTIGKSIQYLLNDPNIRILIANQIWDKARDMLAEIKGHLDDKSELPKLFGSFKSDVWNMDGIVINQRARSLKEPTIATTGVEAESTGGHYDVIFLDDLQGLQNYQTPEQREKVKRFYRSTLNLLEPFGTLIIFGTRWHFDDVYADIIQNESKYYDIVVRQIIENGKVIFPNKFNLQFDRARKCWKHVDFPCLDYVNFLKSSLKPSEFSSQYLNQPIAEEDQKFKQECFRYFDRRPEGLFVGLTVDFAIGQKKEADSTAINVTGMDAKHELYILDALKGRWKTSEIIENVITMYLKWNPDVVGVEENGFQLAVKEGLESSMRQRGIYIAIQSLNHGSEKSKELRIESLEPFYLNGLIHHANWMRGGTLEWELMSFPKGQHDDEVDALSMQLEILAPGDEAFVDAEPKPGTMAWDLQEMDRKQERLNVDSFLRGVIPQ